MCVRLMSNILNYIPTLCVSRVEYYISPVIVLILTYVYVCVSELPSSSKPSFAMTIF